MVWFVSLFSFFGVVGLWGFFSSIPVLDWFGLWVLFLGWVVVCVVWGLVVGFWWLLG